MLQINNENEDAIMITIPYILGYNPHPFYRFRGLKNQMQIRFVVKSWILEK
jgi:hypothetical protein